MKTARIVSLVLALGLLAGCAPAPVEEPSAPSTQAGVIEHIGVHENALESGPHLLADVRMSSADPVTVTAFRQAVATTLEHTAEEPVLVELIFTHGDSFVSSRDATEQLDLNVWFNAGGPVLTGEQARAIAD